MSKNPENSNPSVTARKIWLAGVGAYGRMIEGAQNTLGDIREDSSEVFERLVKRGEKIDAALDGMAEDVKMKASMATGELRETVAKTKNAVTERLEMPDEIKKIHSRLDAIERKLDAVAKPARKTPARTARSAAAKKTGKTA